MQLTEDRANSGEQLDRALLLERVEGDQELLSEMVQLFLDDAPRLLESMRQALERGEKQVLEHSAHSMKGAAGNLAAQAVAAAAFQLEQAARAGNLEAAKTRLAVLEGAVGRLTPVLVELCRGVSK